MILGESSCARPGYRQERLGFNDERDGQFIGTSEADVGLKRHGVLPFTMYSTSSPASISSRGNLYRGMESRALSLAGDALSSDRWNPRYRPPAGAQISVLGVRAFLAMTFTTLPALAK